MLFGTAVRSEQLDDRTVIQSQVAVGLGILNINFEAHEVAWHRVKKYGQDIQLQHLLLPSNESILFRIQLCFIRSTEDGMDWLGIVSIASFLTNLIDFFEEVIKKIDNGTAMVVVYIDFSK
eukprot:g31858.t1